MRQTLFLIGVIIGFVLALILIKPCKHDDTVKRKLEAEEEMFEIDQKYFDRIREQRLSGGKNRRV
jgi:uncharacterized membrane-anchored protein YhcB (DUF1043 family)